MRECRSAGVCQDWLLTVTARLGERGIVMATTTQSQTHFSVSTTEKKRKSFKHLKSSTKLKGEAVNSVLFAYSP